MGKGLLRSIGSGLVSLGKWEGYTLTEQLSNSNGEREKRNGTRVWKIQNTETRTGHV